MQSARRTSLLSRRSTRVSGVGALVLGAFFASACSQGSGAGSTGSVGPTSTVSAEPTSSSAPGRPLALEGMWRDATYDSEWYALIFDPRDRTGGKLTVVPRPCTIPPCAESELGSYDLDGRTIRPHTKALEGKSFEVHIADDTMEWRQDDIAVRRFKKEKPAPPPAPPRSFPSPDAAKPKGTPCGELTAQGCLWSTDCVLVPPAKTSSDRNYICRPASGPCEGGVAQAAPGFEADCRSRHAVPNARGGGCSFRAGECFCPNASTIVKPDPTSPEGAMGGVACACGGGPAQQCLPGE